MDRKEVMAMFNKRPRIGTLSTSNNNGDVNVAVFGSPRMVDENTILMGLGNNRSLQYLGENPKAVFIVMEPGESVADWKGCRVYLNADVIDADGDLLKQVREHVASTSGEALAQMIQAAVRFNITDVRGIIAPV